MLRHAVKRRRTDDAASNPVKGKSTENLKSVKPARELAKPYRVCTAKFPINALTPSWSVGSNRPVNDKQDYVEEALAGEVFLCWPSLNRVLQPRYRLVHLVTGKRLTVQSIDVLFAWLWG
ncbi:hypothetical protein DL98DRAFT_660914 [Cadophora sp. DSE1049]|nr:hypothetical protein DL98DRAFT_660914 [Cadophora sp. DSE1049]